MQTILIADDEKHILDVVEYTLKQSGFATLRATSGREALEIFDAHKPDMAVLDINMPPPDGFEVLKEIRKVSGMPVIFLTSRDDEVDRVV